MVSSNKSFQYLAFLIFEQIMKGKKLFTTEAHHLIGGILERVEEWDTCPGSKI